MRLRVAAVRGPFSCGSVATRTRRCAIVCACVAALLMGGCSSLSGSLVDTGKLAVAQHRSHMPTAAQVAAIPYAQMYAQASHGGAVLVLGNVDGDREAWYGADGSAVFLRHGKVVATAGLDANLEGLQEPATSPFASGLQRLVAPIAYTETMDWSGYRYGVPVHVRLSPAGAAQIDVLGRKVAAIRVDEALDAPTVPWHAINRYWVDARTGFVWKSEQHILPGIKLSLLQLKPYRERP